MEPRPPPVVVPDVAPGVVEAMPLPEVTAVPMAVGSWLLPVVAPVLGLFDVGIGSAVCGFPTTPEATLAVEAASSAPPPVPRPVVECPVDVVGSSAKAPGI